MAVTQRFIHPQRGVCHRLVNMSEGNAETPATTFPVIKFRRLTAKTQQARRGHRITSFSLCPNDTSYI